MLADNEEVVVQRNEVQILRAVPTVAQRSARTMAPHGMHHGDRGARHLIVHACDALDAVCLVGSAGDVLQHRARDMTDEVQMQLIVGAEPQVLQLGPQDNMQTGGRPSSAAAYGLRYSDARCTRAMRAMFSSDAATK